MAIGNFNSPAVSPISVSGRPGSAPSALRVYVKIACPSRGQLSIELVGPNGFVYQLKQINFGDTAAECRHHLHGQRHLVPGVGTVAAEGQSVQLPSQQRRSGQMEPDVLTDPAGLPLFKAGPPVYAAQMPSLLEPVGLAQIHSDLYLDLLTHPRSTAAELASRLDIPIPRVRKALQQLLDVGLASRLVGTRNNYVAAPPEVAVDALVTKRTQQLEQLRLSAHELALRVRRCFRRPSPPS